MMCQYFSLLKKYHDLQLFTFLFDYHCTRRYGEHFFPLQYTINEHEKNTYLVETFLLIL